MRSRSWFLVMGLSTLLFFSYSHSVLASTVHLHMDHWRWDVPTFPGMSFDQFKSQVRAQTNIPIAFLSLKFNGVALDGSTQSLSQLGVDDHSRVDIEIVPPENSLDVVFAAFAKGDIDELNALGFPTYLISSYLPVPSVPGLSRPRFEYKVDLSTLLGREDEQGRTIVHYAAQHRMTWHLTMLEKMATGHVISPRVFGIGGSERRVVGPFNAPDRGGMTPLMYAAAGGHHQTVLYLLPRVDAYLTDVRGFTALHWAATYGNRPDAAAIVEELLPSVGVNIQDKRGRTPLHWAAAGGFGSVVIALLKASPNLDLLDSDKRTAFDLAASYPRVQKLIDSRCFTELSGGASRPPTAESTVRSTAVDSGRTPSVASSGGSRLTGGSRGAGARGIEAGSIPRSSKRDRLRRVFGL